VSRILVCASVLWASFAIGQNRPIAPVDCDDNYAECKEDCAIRFGGNTKMSMRAKLNPCINKCSSVERDCRETFFETKRNNLDEGSISGAPSSRDVDSDGLPTKTAQKKPEPKKVDRHDEELRDSATPTPEPSVSKKKEPEPEPLRQEETPKSTRSSVKTEADKAPPPPVPVKKEEPVAEPAAPPPPKKEEKKREEPPKKDEKKKRALDEWDPDAL